MCPCLKQLSPALPFTSRLRGAAFLRGLICMYSMCSSGIFALSRVGRSRPDREALTPLSLMRVHTGVFSPAHTHVRTGVPILLFLSFILSFLLTHEVSELALSDRQMLCSWDLDVSFLNTRIHAVPRASELFPNRLLRIHVCALCPLQQLPRGLTSLLHPQPPFPPRLPKPPPFSIISCRAAIRSWISPLCVSVMCVRKSAAGVPASVCVCVSMCVCVFEDHSPGQTGEIGTQSLEREPPSLHLHHNTHTHSLKLYREIKHLSHR